MIIGNIKSSQDLASKRNLQRELLELEISNEAELERRVKDFKDPNKPIPVAPRYRTNAELQKDRIDQERVAIKNMEDLGFDYNKGADLVSWLSGSDIDRLVEFNANFKGIKKELTETTNPKLLTLDYVKNYLERFFEDLDVSFGRKMTGQTGMMVSSDVSIDELQNNLPQERTINDLFQGVSSVLDAIRKINADANVSLNGSLEKTDEILADYPIVSRLYQEIADLEEENQRVERIMDIKEIELNEMKVERDTQKNILNELQATNASSSEITAQKELFEKLKEYLINVKDEKNDLDKRNRQIKVEIDDLKNKIKGMRDKPNLYSVKKNPSYNSKNTGVLKKVNILENKIDALSNIHEKGLFSTNLISLLNLVIPNDEFLNIFKISLPLLQRTELVKRYARLLARLKAPTEQSLNEVLGEVDYALQQTQLGSIEFADYLFTKINKMLSFLSSQRNTDAITSLNRNYEAEIAKTDKTGDLQKIKQINDRNESEIARLKEEMRNVGKSIMDLETAVLSKNPAGRAIEGRKAEFTIKAIEDASELEMETDKLARQGRLRDVVSGIIAETPSQIEPRKSLKLLFKGRKVERKVGDAIFEEEFVNYISSLPEEEVLPELIRLREDADTRVLAEEMLKRAGISEAFSKFSGKIKGKKIREEEEKIKIEEQAKKEQKLNQEKQHRKIMRRHYEDIWKEITQINTSGGRYNSIRKLVDEATDSIKMDAPNIRQEFVNISTTAGTKDEKDRKIANEFKPVYDAFIEYKIQKYGRDLSYDLMDKSRSDYLEVDEWDGANWGNVSQVRKLNKGLGLAKSIKKHFRDDEKELREMARDLNRHKKEEDKIDKSVDFKHKRIKVGRGVELEDEPTYRTFGKYVIHMKHLKGKGVANFKYPSLGSIPSIKPKPITEEYREFIIDILETGKPNERQFRRLSEDEREHFERVCSGAGLLEHFRMKRTGDDEDKERVDRFNILRGEVLAGNNNENVIKELRGLVVRFINEGRITRQEGTNMLMELSAL